MANWPDARVKQRLTAELLRFRQAHLALFQQGDYEPLAATGEFADKVVAFRRCHNDECVVVVVPRLTASLSDWGDTSLALPKGWERWNAVLSPETRQWGSAHPVFMRELFAELPVAVLVGY
jgi:(1->4)-alpha-D-glucan 1-alpha-D-glucosylmutase